MREPHEPCPICPSGRHMRSPCGASQLAVDAAHAVAAPPCLVSPVLACRDVGLAAVALLQHLPKQRLLLLHATACKVRKYRMSQH